MLRPVPINHKLTDSWETSPDLSDLLKQLALPEVDRAAAVFEHVLDLSSLHSGVNRHCNHTGEEAAKICDRNLGTIVHVYCDAIARFEVASDESRREALCLGIELCIGKHSVFQTVSGLVGKTTCGIAQQEREGHTGLLQITGELERAAGKFPKDVHLSAL